MFIPISIDNYVKTHLKSNPAENEKVLRVRLEAAINKIDKHGRKHIDEMDPTKITGFFSDDGYEINPDLIKKPSLCLICQKNYEPGLEDDILCNLNRSDQRNDNKFKCYSYEKMKN